MSAIDKNSTKQCKVIGLTGGIGSGKTAVTDYLKKQGFVIIDSDIIAREVVAPNSKGLQEVVKEFGKEFLLDNGHLDRKKLRDLIFSNPQKKHQLESILHPLIQAETRQLIDQNQSLPIIFIAIPLLIEITHRKGKPDYIDEIWVVECDPETQINRAMSRDNSSREQIQKIISQQASSEQRQQLANHLIDNNSDKAHLYEQIEQLLKMQLPAS